MYAVLRSSKPAKIIEIQSIQYLVMTNAIVY